jgi:hypothetical protein
MRHLVIYLISAKPRLDGELKKFNLASTLTWVRPGICWFGKRPESVDAARVGLYKTANGGGRNPAADVL